MSAGAPDGLGFDRSRLEELVAESERRVRAALTVQRDLAALRASVRSRDRSISVSVDARGALTGITFHTDGYRAMAPAELTRLILDTVKAADGQLAARVRETTAPLRTDDRLPSKQIMSGTFDPVAFLEGR